MLVALGIVLVRERTELGGDTATGIFFAVSVALGVLFLALKHEYTEDAFALLFGSILAVDKIDLWLSGGVALLPLVTMPLWGRWAYATFDRELAEAHRLNVRRHDHVLAALIAVTVVVAVKVVGITGSIGKTTTKEFAATLLARNFEVLKSEGNYNNHIGLPLSILKLKKNDEVTVLEMGMSSTGEIARLTQIAPPDIAVVTNIHPVHLEFFNNIEEIAQAKKEILDGLKPNGIAVLNGDDPAVGKIAEDWKGTKLLFGLSEGCDIRAKNIQRI